MTTVEGNMLTPYDEYAVLIAGFSGMLRKLEEQTWKDNRLRPIFSVSPYEGAFEKRTIRILSKLRRTNPDKVFCVSFSLSCEQSRFWSIWHDMRSVFPSAITLHNSGILCTSPAKKLIVKYLKTTHPDVAFSQHIERGMDARVSGMYDHHDAKKYVKDRGLEAHVEDLTPILQAEFIANVKKQVNAACKLLANFAEETPETQPHGHE